MTRGSADSGHDGAAAQVDRPCPGTPVEVANRRAAPPQAGNGSRPLAVPTVTAAPTAPTVMATLAALVVPALPMVLMALTVLMVPTVPVVTGQAA